MQIELMFYSAPSNERINVIKETGDGKDSVGNRFKIISMCGQEVSHEDILQSYFGELNCCFLSFTWRRNHINGVLFFKTFIEQDKT